LGNPHQAWIPPPSAWATTPIRKSTLTNPARTQPSSATRSCSRVVRVLLLLRIFESLNLSVPFLKLHCVDPRLWHLGKLTQSHSRRRVQFSASHGRTDGQTFSASIHTPRSGTHTVVVLTHHRRIDGTLSPHLRLPPSLPALRIPTGKFQVNVLLPRIPRTPRRPIRLRLVLPRTREPDGLRLFLDPQCFLPSPNPISPLFCLSFRTSNNVNRNRH
jgi:hypothetical protein